MNDLLNDDLIEILIEIIKSKKLTQIEIAKLLNTDQPKISKLLNKVPGVFSFGHMLKFINLLGHDIDIIIKKSKFSYGSITIQKNKI